MGWLEQRLKDNSLLVLPGVFDCISAKLLAEIQFEGCYCSGFVTAASAYGLPDLGLLDSTEMYLHFKRISTATNLPLIVDGDTGYGGLLNTFRTFEKLADAGVSAVHIEDQENPKRCGHLSGKSVISFSDATQRLGGAILAGKEFGIDVIARTDALTCLGKDEAIDRCNMFIDQGATAVFVDGIKKEKEFMEFPSSINGPMLFNAARFKQLENFSALDIKKAGYAIAIYPGELIAAASSAVKTTLEKMLDPNFIAHKYDIGLDEINQLTKQNEMIEKEKLMAKITNISNKTE
jgi:methylisocitrate lyase